MLFLLKKEYEVSSSIFLFYVRKNEKQKNFQATAHILHLGTPNLYFDMQIM